MDLLAATKDFGVDDKEIIDAVRYHTTGRPCMTMLDKIIYIGRRVSRGRSYPGVEELRREAESDIDKACLDSLKLPLPREIFSTDLRQNTWKKR